MCFVLGCLLYSTLYPCISERVIFPLCYLVYIASIVLYYINKQSTVACILPLFPLTNSSSLHPRLCFRDPHSLDTSSQVRSYNLYQSLPICLSHLCHSCRLLLHGLFAPSSRQCSRNQTLFGLIGGFVPSRLPHSLRRYDAFTTLTPPIQTT